MIVEAIFAVFFGLLMLAFGADRFIDGAITFSSHLRIPPLIVGIIVVGFATSAPELVVSMIAAFGSHPTLSIGNAIGSNIANLGLVLGITAIVFPLKIHSSVLKVEYPLMVAGLLISSYLMIDQELTVLDGLVLLVALLMLLIAMIVLRKGSFNTMEAKEDSLCGPEPKESLSDRRTIGKALFWLVAGLLLLLLGSEFLVDGAVVLARLFGATDIFIGLTIVAIGTSLPELAASFASALKKETDMAIGNVIGSNLFNALGVIAMPALIYPCAIESVILKRDVGSMWLLTLLLMALMLFKAKNNVLGRLAGVILLLSFFCYQFILFSQQ